MPHTSQAQVWRVEVVHSTVAGRVRFRVPGLRSGPAVVEALESLLARLPHVHESRISPVTGSVLVVHDGTAHADALRQALNEAVAGALSRRPPVVADLWTAPADRTTPRPLSGPEPPAPWHTLEPWVVLDLVQGDGTVGLSGDRVGDARARWGSNRIPVTPPRSTLEIALKQFDSVPVWLLLGSAALSVGTGGISDAVAILLVVAVNAGVGTYTESLSERTISALPRLDPGPVPVLRDGRRRRVHPDEVVVGDVILLHRGQAVPADARILESDGLTVDESALTGESMPVSKTAEADLPAGLPLAERRTMVFRGTVVTGGSGRAAVVATGSGTEVGHIQALVAGTAKRATPIERQLEQMGRQLAGVAGLASGAVFLIGVVRGQPVLALVRSTVSLAVASIPEGLPTVATTTLAFGVQRMQKRGIYMRRLEVAEALGAMQVLCLDKTGTLTANRMRATSVRCASPARPALLEVCLLNREALDDGVPPDSPTENALLRLATEYGREGTGDGAGDGGAATRARRWTRLGIQARSESRMYVTTVHRMGQAGEAGEPDAPWAPVQGAGGELLVTVKGRPDQVLDLCDRVWAAEGIRPLTDADRDAWYGVNEAMGEEALRVLAMARVTRPRDTDPVRALAVEDSRDLVWLGLVGLEDPIRPGAREMIRRFREAGIRTVMITGDQSATAYAVARKLGLAGGDQIQIVDSMELSRVDPRVLAGLARQVHVFSRVSPAQKLLIVDVLQQSGLVVGMTGDGINDGPALRKADVGIALRTDGGAVAEEIADVILSQGDLDGLLTAVASGRTLGDDIGKAVHYIASTNMSEVLFSLLTMAATGEVALNPRQLLWINILSDVAPELALSVEPPEEDVLARPPRDPDLPLIPPTARSHILEEAGILTGTTVAAWLWGVSRHGTGARAGTVAFMALTVAQLLHTISARSETHTVFDGDALPPNRWVSWAIGSGLTLQLLAEGTAVLRHFLGNTRIDALDALVAGGTAASSFILNETLKLGHTAPAAMTDGGDADLARLEEAEA